MGYVRAITSLARAIQNTRDRSFVLETKARGKSGSFRKILKKRTRVREGSGSHLSAAEEIPEEIAEEIKEMSNSRMN